MVSKYFRVPSFLSKLGRKQSSRMLPRLALLCQNPVPQKGKEDSTAKAKIKIFVLLSVFKFRNGKGKPAVVQYDLKSLGISSSWDRWSQMPWRLEISALESWPASNGIEIIPSNDSHNLQSKSESNGRFQTATNFSALERDHSHAEQRDSDQTNKDEYNLVMTDEVEGTIPCKWRCNGRL